MHLSISEVCTFSKLRTGFVGLVSESERRRIKDEARRLRDEQRRQNAKYLSDAVRLCLIYNLYSGSLF